MKQHSYTDRLSNTVLAALTTLLDSRAAMHSGQAEAGTLLSQGELATLVEHLRENPNSTIQAVVSGGLFRSANSEHPLARMFGIEVLDFDVEGCSDVPSFLANAADGSETAVPVHLGGEGVGSDVLYRVYENPDAEAA